MRLSRIAMALTLGATLCAPTLMPAALAQTASNSTATQNRPVAPPTAPAPSGAPAPAMAMKPMAMSAPVNINTATEAQLDTVPQIGPKRAASIIKNRPYKSLDELVSKKALSNGIFQKVKAHLTV